jgi:chemotaxis protein histidine kinase CheA
MLKEAASAADWKLATHTLKGSAAAVGAGEINRLALELETCPLNDGLRTGKIEGIEAAVLRFEQVCRETFG